MNNLAAAVAVTATATAVCLSVVAGWQRGGWATERVLWIAVGVVLVIAAHLLPALCRSYGWRVRIVGAVLWLACMAATCYGHAVFFLMAQKHAGELRAAAVPVFTAKGRGLAEIARDHADAVTRLARTNARRCVGQCPNLIAERTAAAARVDALDVEWAEAQHAEAAQDRAAKARDAAAHDPVTGALTAFGMPVAHADLVAGLAFAAELEGVACFAWLLALRPAVVTIAPVANPVTLAQQGSNAEAATAVTPVTGIQSPVATEYRGYTPDVSDPLPPPPQPVTAVTAAQGDDVTRVRSAVAAGTLRGTVTEIRRFLNCSQSRAAAIRKQLIDARGPL